MHSKCKLVGILQHLTSFSSLLCHSAYQTSSVTVDYIFTAADLLMLDPLIHTLKLEFSFLVDLLIIS